MSSTTRTVDVQVGTGPSSIRPFVFTPSAITAPNGTTVIFSWTGQPGNHSVTQSSFEAPCTPKSGGVDSGLQFVSADATNTPQWSFTVNNDQIPLYFYCRQLLPASHCHAGMVMAVNLPSSQSFDAFQSAAMSLGTSSSASGSQASQTSSSGSPTSPSNPAISSPAPSTTNVVPPPGGKHVPVAAIAGSAIGALVILLLCIAAFFVCRRRIARKRGPRPLSARAETLLEFGPEDGVDTRPQSLILYEKGVPTSVDSSSSTTMDGSTSALPTAAEAALMTMAEDMRQLRDQVQRLELDRQRLGLGDMEEERPPEYEKR